MILGSRGVTCLARHPFQKAERSRRKFFLTNSVAGYQLTQIQNNKAKLVAEVRLGINLGYSSKDTELITCVLAGIVQLQLVTIQQPNKAASNSEQQLWYGDLSAVQA